MSVLPGKYRCFDGGKYRVLFTVLVFDQISPVADSTIYIVARGYGDPATGGIDIRFDPPLLNGLDDDELIIAAEWVGYRTPEVKDEIVVYCTLDGVYARTEKEFTGSVHHEQRDVPRFERVGE